MKYIDITSDLGESFGCYKLGDTAEILDVVSSANLACGFHAGDPTVMNETVALCAEKGVAIGAHIGYPDLQGFGRRKMDFKLGELYELALYQMGALEAFTRVHGVKIRHMNCHGALGNLIQKDEGVADAISKAVADFDPSIKIAAPNARSAFYKAAINHGLGVITDMFYFDRNLDEEQYLVPRGTPNAVITDDDYAMKRIIRAIKENRVYAVTGKDMKIAPPKRILIHGDQPKALTFARQLRAMLVDEGIGVCYYSDMTND